MNPKTYQSNGKLLLTGEYVVLDGALSLAVPTKFGQSMHVENIDQPKIIWKSLDEKGVVWFEHEFLISDVISGFSSFNSDISNRMAQILNVAKQLNQDFLKTMDGYKITTSLSFPKDWGLGTSSTLINNIAQWANIDAYALLEKTFGGSGYDIACAKKNHSIIYNLEGKRPIVKHVDFDPVFKEHLYFVYLNKKQDSREGIANYRARKPHSKNIYSEISDITTKMISCKSLINFDRLIFEHEQLIATIIKQKPIKQILFNDFNGQIKSLGAWGGDFILASSESNPSNYFKQKGFKTILPYTDMVLNNA